RGRWQVTAFREIGTADIDTTVRTSEKDHDPTLHPTFQVAARRRNAGRVVWTDLCYAEADAELEESKRRVVVDVMRAVVDRDANFLGVVRAGLLADQLDRIVAEVTKGRVRAFLCDEQGRLLTRTGAADALQDDDGDLRIAPRSPLGPAFARTLGIIANEDSDD